MQIILTEEEYNALKLINTEAQDKIVAKHRKIICDCAIEEMRRSSMSNFSLTCSQQFVQAFLTAVRLAIEKS